MVAEGVGRERMPSIRFGTVHIYNNYYSSAGNNYCVRVRLSGRLASRTTRSRA